VIESVLTISLIAVISAILFAVSIVPAYLF